VHVLSPAVLASDLAIPDLTLDPDHAVRRMVDAITSALAARWGCELRIVRSHPIVSTDDNYDRLGFPPDAVTREARYSRYVSETCLLRTHTSAMIPAALRGLSQSLPVGDVLLACPGVVYRRDAIDRLHTGTPHQLDLWRVTDARPTGKPLAVDDLDEMIATVVAAALPGGTAYRVEPRSHPYTEQGLQIDAHVGGEWVEIGECGLASPRVLRGAGLPFSVSGLAMGLGLDRLVMLRKGIPDIRLLRSPDQRVRDQLRDLDTPYRVVSTHPPIRRDVSVAVGSDVDEEALGDRVRDALGVDADAVESVEVVGSTPGDALPAIAIDRLGLQPGQRNLLVRIVLRHVDRTLTDAEANGLRDRIHAAIHEGTVPLQS
jgi:phenylalanyl-tRNA synthetase alpha chain